MPVFEDDEDKESDELIGLSSIQEELSALKNNKEINQSMLAAVQALADAVEDMTEARKKNELGTALDGSLTKLSEAIIAMAKNSKVDLSPLTRGYQSVATLVSELKDQNKKLMEVISGLMADDSKEEARHLSVLRSLQETIKATNANLENSVEKMDYTKELQKIANRPLSWRHQVHYNRGKVDYIDSTAVK